MNSWKLSVAAIVDRPDNTELLRQACAQVPGWNLQLSFFPDWGQATSALRNSPFDAIFVDFTLGDTSGVEIIEYLRHRGDERPMLILAGPADEELAVDALHRGADDYLRTARLEPDSIRRSLIRSLAQSTLRIEKARAEEALRASEAKFRRLADELAEANRQLSLFVTTDALTGLANRRHFDDILESELRRAARNGDPLSLLFCDVDFFKHYNDNFGHPAGDACLRQVGALLLASFRREGELPARYGGEEFTVILPRVAEDEAFAEAERLRTALESLHLSHRRPDGHPWVTLSAGVATLHVSAGNTPAQLIELADQALLVSKANGRNRTTRASLTQPAAVHQRSSVSA